MEKFCYKNIIHKLVNNIIKICDFGLARCVNKDDDDEIVEKAVDNHKQIDQKKLAKHSELNKYANPSDKKVSFRSLENSPTRFNTISSVGERKSSKVKRKSETPIFSGGRIIIAFIMFYTTVKIIGPENKEKWFKKRQKYTFFNRRGIFGEDINFGYPRTWQGMLIALGLYALLLGGGYWYVFVFPY